MDVSKMIAALREECARLDEIIISLEKLSLAGRPRRGQPPAWSRLANVNASHGRNGQNGSTDGASLSLPRD
jgi:hypothetical protein